MNGRIIYLLLRRYCSEMSEVDSQEAHTNWPHLVLEFLEDNISWIEPNGVCESGIENELRNIPDDTPKRISCKPSKNKMFKNLSTHFYKLINSFSDVTNSGGLIYRVEYENSGMFVAAAVAKSRWPKLVIEFLERNLNI